MSDRKKQSEYQAKYDAKNMKQYSIKYPIQIYRAVEKAMANTGMNRNKWTTTAIVEKLERDGYIQSKDNSDQAANTEDDKLPGKNERIM